MVKILSLVLKCNKDDMVDLVMEERCEVEWMDFLNYGVGKCGHVRRDKNDRWTWMDDTLGVYTVGDYVHMEIDKEHNP